MEIETITDNQRVPKEFSCPVCGKWGRKMLHGWNFPHGYLYCNPKARRGGKGCGEIFKRIKTPACSRIELPAIVRKEEKRLRMVAMGFEMIQILKDEGKHDPYTRKVLNRDVYGLWFSTRNHLKESGLCLCGCGKEAIYSGNKYATADCGDIIYSTAQMIASQDNQLKKLLIALRGKRCECCAAEDVTLEVDHIIEVVNGGGLCWIDNFQLLCQKCHKAKTAKLATERANQRKSEQVAATGQMSMF